MMRSPRLYVVAGLLFAVACDGNTTPLPTALGVAPLAVVECDANVSYAAIDDLLAAVNALETSGALTSGQASALRNHLQNALRSLNAGNHCAAEAQLTAFQQQVQNFVRNGTLTEEEADPLQEGASARLLFTTNRDGNSEIYSMNADGSDKTRLTNDLLSDFSATWFPDGKKILFIRGTGVAPNADNIWVMNSDGSGPTNLTNDAAAYHFAISPNGSRIAFSTNRSGNFAIYVMNADGTGQTQITNGAGQDVAPNWSPDGSRLLFVSARDGNREIYVMNPDGTGQTRLTVASGNDDETAWSPNGSSIVFSSERSGARELYLMNPDGSNQRALTSGNAENNAFPEWSPDGSKIAFSSGRTGKRQIFVMNADGSGQTNVTANTSASASENTPHWSPDGGRIAFMSFRDGNFEVYVMKADGSGQTNLSSNSGSDTINSDRAWRP